MMVALETAMSFPLRSARVCALDLGETTSPKQRLSGEECEVVATIACGEPLSFCMRTLMMSPKCPLSAPARMAAPSSSALWKGTSSTSSPCRDVQDDGVGGGEDAKLELGAVRGLDGGKDEQGKED